MQHTHVRYTHACMYTHTHSLTRAHTHAHTYTRARHTHIYAHACTYTPNAHTNRNLQPPLCPAGNLRLPDGDAYIVPEGFQFYHRRPLLPGEDEEIYQKIVHRPDIVQRDIYSRPKAWQFQLCLLWLEDTCVAKRTNTPTHPRTHTQTHTHTHAFAHLLFVHCSCYALPFF